MRALTLAVCALPLGGLLLLAHLFPLYPAPPAGSDEEQEREARLVALVARNQARSDVTGDVLAGRRSLPDAASLFRELDARWPPPRYDLRPDLGGRSAADRCCARVIAHARARLAEHPARSREVTARLEAERERLWEGGDLGPPD